MLGGVKSTGENLQAAMSGEAHEFTEMYPGFVAEAERAGSRGAVVSFSNARAVEKIHHRLYAEAARAVSAGKALPPRGNPGAQRVRQHRARRSAGAVSDLWLPQGRVPRGGLAAFGRAVAASVRRGPARHRLARSLSRACRGDQHNAGNGQQ